MDKYTNASHSNGSGLYLDEDLHVRDSGSIVLQVVQYILSLLVIVSNSVVLAVIKHSTTLHKVAYYLLGNLAVADSLIAAVSITENICIRLGQYPCIVKALTVLSRSSSLSATFLLVLQGFLAVTFPVRCRRGLSIRVALALLGVCWSVSASTVLCALLEEKQVQETPESCKFNACPLVLFFKPFSWLSLLSSVVLHLLTLLQMGIKYSRERRRVRGASTEVIATSTAAMNRLRRMRGGMGIVSVVLLFTVLSWGFTGVMSMLVSVCQRRENCPITHPHLVQIISILLLLNGLVNVFVYFSKDAVFTSVMTQVYEKLRRACRSNTVMPQSIETNHD